MYEVIRMPTNETELTKLLEEYTPFLSVMYTPDEETLFGPVNFILDHWLFLWDTGAGYFLTKRNNSGELVLLAMLTQYRDLWSGRPRLEIHRVAVGADLAIDSDKEVTGMVEYLKSVSSLLRFDFLFFNSRDEKGNEYKELIWSNGAPR